MKCDRSGLLLPSQLSLLVLSGSYSWTEISQEGWRTGIIDGLIEGGQPGVTDAADYKLTP